MEGEKGKIYHVVVEFDDREKTALPGPMEAADAARARYADCANNMDSHHGVRLRAVYLLRHGVVVALSKRGEERAQLLVMHELRHLRAQLLHTGPLNNHFAAYDQATREAAAKLLEGLLEGLMK